MKDEDKESNLSKIGKCSDGWNISCSILLSVSVNLGSSPVTLLNAIAFIKGGESPGSGKTFNHTIPAGTVSNTRRYPYEQPQ